MKISLLDSATFGDFFELEKPSFPCEWKTYKITEPSEVLERIQDIDIAIINKVVLNREVLEKTEKLKLIALAATGYNIVDLDCCKEKGILVCNIRDYAFDSVPEHTFALILALRKNILGYKKALQDGLWQESGQFCLFLEPVHCLSGSRLGIIGSGSLGQAVAKLGEAFGMDVCFAQRKFAERKFAQRKFDRRKEEKNSSQQFQQKFSQNNGFSNKYLPFEEIIETSSVISVHCPLLPETKDLISKKELKKMRKDCLLINNSRGGIVNEADLVEAIKEKRIAGAGIDVVTEEPPGLSHPYHSILNYPNFILTPHTAWIGLSTIKRAWNQVIENIENFKKGKPTRVVC